MKHKVFTRRLACNSEAGTSLVELLITLSIAGLIMVALSGFMSNSSSASRETDVHMEASQGLRALFEVLSQELRQAGACLPSGGDFIALGGADAGTLDSLTVRVGHTDPTTLACVMAASISDAADGANTIEVADADADALEINDRLYITPNGANGTFYTLEAKSGGATGTNLHLTPPLDGNHNTGSGIFPTDQRDYAIESPSGSQMMTLAIDQGPSHPLIDNVEAFNVQYHLAPCDETGCDTIIDLPADSAEWSQVRLLTLSATIKSHRADKDGNFVYQSNDIVVKPRNLID